MSMTLEFPPRETAPVPGKFVWDPEKLLKIAAICDNPRAFPLR
jgi:hypothetical protein